MSTGYSFALRRAESVLRRFLPCQTRYQEALHFFPDDFDQIFRDENSVEIKI